MQLSPLASQVLFWSATIVAVCAQALVLRAAVAGRTPAAGTGTSLRARELVWIILPAVALGFALVATWRALPRSFDPTSSAAPTAVVTATERRGDLQ